MSKQASRSSGSAVSVAVAVAAGRVGWWDRALEMRREVKDRALRSAKMIPVRLIEDSGPVDADAGLEVDRSLASGVLGTALARAGTDQSAALLTTTATLDTHSMMVRITLANGVRLEVDRHFDGATLSRWVEMLSC